MNGDPKRAKLVREYFDGKLPPPPRVNSSSSQTTVHDMLRNDRYFGFVPFGAMRNRLAIGDGPRRVRGKEELFEAPHLPIVPPALEAAVKKRAEALRSVYRNAPAGALPATGRASQFLLSGLMRCKEYGGAMVVASQGVRSEKGQAPSAALQLQRASQSRPCGLQEHAARADGKGGRAGDGIYRADHA